MPDSIKQTVQWYPGHMAKTERLIKESLKLVDLVAVLLDARIPYSSENPEINDLTKNKPKIFLLNKSDLADKKTTDLWINYFKKSGTEALAIDCRSGAGLNKFTSSVKKVLSDKIKKNEEKGLGKKPLRIMAAGIPNTGKSSFINILGRKNRAKTEDRAGVTRSNQWYALGNGIEILDTPGVLWPKFYDPSVGDNLAFTGGIKDDVFDTETLSLRLLKIIVRDYPENLASRYKINDFSEKSAETVLDEIALKRGMLRSGGIVDRERAAAILLDEFRAGKLGRISLEKPPLNG